MFSRNQNDFTRFVVIIECEQALPWTTPALTTPIQSLNSSTDGKRARHFLEWEVKLLIALSLCHIFNVLQGVRCSRPRNLGHCESKPFLCVILYHVWFSILRRLQVRRKEAPRWTRPLSISLGDPMREISLLFARSSACGPSRNKLDQDYPSSRS